MKKLVSVLLSMMLVVTLLPVSNASAADDITGIALEKEMRAMVEQGVIEGYGNGKYAPGEKVSRGQFATFLARALKLPNGPHTFSDVPVSSKLAPGINAAVAAKIVSGYSKTIFKPNDLITRAQMAIMINRSLDYLKIKKVEAPLNFTDAKSLSPEAKQAVSYMVGLKIISGFPDGNGFAFKPNQTASRAEAAAFIYRMQEAQKKQEEETTPPTNPDPDPEQPEKFPYNVGTLDAQGKVTEGSKTYKTFAEANSAITNSNNQVVLYNGEIIKMKNGIVVSKPRSGLATTTIYESNLKTIYAAVPTGSELEYVTSDEGKITVKAAGRTGYVFHNDAYLIPKQAMKGQSYYSVNSAGDLIHNLFNHTTNKYTSYIAGKAPSSFKTGVKYMSWDGAAFKNENGAAIGKFYQYFNMLPARTSTNYTAEQLESIITTRLAEREALYKKDPKTYLKYKDATKKSKLIGLGKIVKDFEKQHKINGLMILSMAIHESDYGMSNHAQKNNNIFGIKVFDSDPLNGEAYKSIRDCVASLVNNYLNKNYIPVNGAYANGGMLGNKSRGFNVRYATDPYWGQKIAGHMYQLDKALGGKDFLNNPNPYVIHETTADDLNVRSSAGVTSSNKIYTYKRPGYPVAVLGTTGSWHKIFSDSKEHLHGYVSTSYTQALPIAK